MAEHDIPEMSVNIAKAILNDIAVLVINKRKLYNYLQDTEVGVAGTKRCVRGGRTLTDEESNV